MKLLLLLLPFFVSAQISPDVVSLSTAQGTPGSNDATWEVNTQWLVVEPINTLLLNYTDAYINNNYAPGACVEPFLLPPSVNNGNWITSDVLNRKNKRSSYSGFRLELDLLSDSNIKDFNSNSLLLRVYDYVIKNTNNENKTGWIF